MLPPSCLEKDALRWLLMPDDRTTHATELFSLFNELTCMVLVLVATGGGLASNLGLQQRCRRLCARYYVGTASVRATAGSHLGLQHGVSLFYVIANVVAVGGPV
jgi:hypothetical protein